MSFLQAQAAPASPCPRAPIGHPPTAPFDIPAAPLCFETAERGGAELAGRVDVLGAEAFASQPSKAAAAVSRVPELTLDPDLDPSAALLLRVEPAGTTELRLDQIGHNGQDGVTEGQAAHRERLLALRAAALAVGEGSHLNFSKNPAPGSRPPALSSDLRPTASSSSAPAPREADDASQAALLPVGGEDMTHTQEENR